MYVNIQTSHKKNPDICSSTLEIKHDDIDNDDDGGIQSRRSLATCCSTLEIEYFCICLLYYDASDDVEYDGGDGDQVDYDGGDDEEELFFCSGTLEIKRQTALFAILCILMEVDMLKIYQDIQKWKWSVHKTHTFLG